MGNNWHRIVNRVRDKYSSEDSEMLSPCKLSELHTLLWAEHLTLKSSKAPLSVLKVLQMQRLRGHRQL